MTAPKHTPYAAAMLALTGAAAAFDRAKKAGYVWIEDDRLFAVGPLAPAGSDNPEQLRLDGC